MKRLVLFFMMSLAFSASAGELKSFTTDGCSAFPDGTFNNNSLWLDCCIRHDIAYWKGGSFEDRRAADEVLKECVANIGEPGIARLMEAGVRLGGTPYFPTTYRWGYGWSYARGYKTLDAEEQAQVHRKLNELRQVLDSLEESLDKMD